MGWMGFGESLFFGIVPNPLLESQRIFVGGVSKACKWASGTFSSTVMLFGMPCQWPPASAGKGLSHFEDGHQGHLTSPLQRGGPWWPCGLAPCLVPAPRCGGRGAHSALTLKYTDHDLAKIGIRPLTLTQGTSRNICLG